MLKKASAFLIASCCVMSLAWAQANDNWYEGKPISAISFEGLEYIARGQLDTIFSQYKGQKWTYELYLEILQKVYDLEYFSEVSPKAVPTDPEYQYVMLQFTVKERPSVKGIKMVGNSQIRSGDLLFKILLKKGDIYNEVKMKVDQESLRRHYLDQGYAAVKISCEAKTEAGGVVVQFTIQEGKQTVVSRIQFKGNKAFTESVLKKVLSTQEARFLTSGVFKENALEADKAAVHSYYAERGYIDARVEGVAKTVDKKTDASRNLVTLTYTVVEGEQYRYNGVTIVGNQIFSTEELQAKIRLKRGAIMNMVAFEQGFQALADAYFENGYTSNYLNKEEHRDTAEKTLSFKITVVERERSHVEHIIIKGTKNTKDEVILREMLLKPGDVFSKSKFTDSLRNLFNLRYFSSLVPDVRPGSEQDLVDIILNVEEQSTANVQFGVTFSGVGEAGTFPLSLFCQWEEKNFLGKGNEISVNATLGSEAQSLKLGYVERWFLGSPLTVGFDFELTHKNLFVYRAGSYGNGLPHPYTSREQWASSPGLAESFRLKYSRFESAIGAHTGYQWYPRYAVIRVNGGVDFRVVKNFYDKDNNQPFDQTVKEQLNWTSINSFWTSVSFDGRDFAYDPSSGWFLGQRCTFNGLVPFLEKEHSFRSDTKAEFYVTLLNYPVSAVWNLKFVLAFYTGVSVQTYYGRRKSENGKSNGVRSGALVIDGVLVGRGWSEDAKKNTGDLLLHHWIEFRWPLAHGIVSFDFFFDAAMVYNIESQSPNGSSSASSSSSSSSSSTEGLYKMSYGPGLRFTLPQFPLKLAFANTFTSAGGIPKTKKNWNFVLSFTVNNL
ncbi:outer membrane protein assembly factor BamA [Treponema pallidum]|uniref:Outer membrane protein assembly factor BamA n=4 Tax=Treponema TaxID=157 RepID=Q9LA48_9SPIR|nr:outer membrane protein assembly factor BamA [Treponema pallidum]AAF61475.1 Tp92 [Treponema sp. 'simian isolate']AGK83965.1 outer membrane protein [Treponema pallidum str. Fribourg-Blanc]